MGKNLVHIDVHYGDFICYACNRREFTTKQGLLQHCRTASCHHGEWCGRCERLFSSNSARNAHVQNSSDHWKCLFCNIDEPTQEAIEDHTINSHNACYDCGIKYSTASYHDHRVERHHRCQQCSKEFDSENDLSMHRQTHISESKTCYGCPHKFPSVSAMMVHLESGSCESGVDCDDIDEWTFERGIAETFILDHDECPFQCSRCNSCFPYISSLFQHAESQICSVRQDDHFNRLTNHLRKRVEECYDNQ